MSEANRLPKWVISNDESVWKETEVSRRQTPEERWADVLAACDTLKLYWSIPGYPERVKNAEDPMPESSRAAFKRLREGYRRDRK